MKPLLHWVGGKSWLAPRISEVINRGGTYHEPFLGGGSVFLYLAQHGLVDRAVLSDGSARLVNMYRQVQADPVGVSRELRSLPQSDYANHYYELRNQFNSHGLDPLESAALLLWLNKTGFNGLYRENLSGGYNVPVGTCKPNIYFPSEEHLVEVSRLLQRATISWIQSRGWCESADIQPGDSIYADPPYVPEKEGGFTGYVAGQFTRTDQEHLAGALTNFSYRDGVSIGVSNHDSDYTRRLYYSFKFELYSRQRLVSAGDRNNSTEIFFYV